MRAFLQHPQSLPLRRALFQVHLWLGVLAGAYLLVVCVTGSALVFRIELQRVMHPGLFTPSAPGPLAHPADVIEALQAAFPHGRVAGVDAPTTARPTYLAYVSQDDRFLTILLDPVTSAPLGELPPDSVVRWIQDLHFDLLAGRTGRIVNGVGALLLLALCATGLIIWWPGATQWRRAFTVDLRRSWRRITWDLHSAVGIWTVGFIAMWAVTGLYFVFPPQIRAAIHAVSPLTVARAPLPGSRDIDRNSARSTANVTGDAPSVRALIDEALRRMPDQFVARVVIPADERTAFHVLFSDRSPTPVHATLQSVYLDQFTGALLQEPLSDARTAGDALVAWIGPVHVGSFGGVGVKVAWLVLGLAPPLLFVTGFALWWTRVVRSRWLRAGAVDAGRVQNSSG